MLLVGAAVFLLAALVVAGVVAFSRGVALDIRPAEVAHEARITVTQGVAFPLANAVYILGHEATVTVTAPGFRSAAHRLDATSFGATRIITLTPLPGEVIAVADPPLPDVAWTLDDAPVHQGGEFRRELSPGTYRIGVTHPFFVPQDGEATVRRGAPPVRLTFTLVPVAGQFSVSSIPTGAQVQVNGKPMGVTPLDLPLAGGDYAISVQHAGFDLAQETVRITNRSPTLTRNYRLGVKAAYLTVSVEPPGGLLLVDGRKAEPDTPVTLNRAAGHAYRVHYEKPGYGSESREVTVPPGTRQRLAIRLAPTVGQVEISADPPAAIFIDGTAHGTTPATLTLPTRDAVLELRRPGYLTERRTIRPRAGTPTRIAAQLKNERAARIAAAPPTYQNALGMEFRLFGPAEFRMGAPRHEEGQRANEFLRDVRLTRHFYAGLHEVSNEQYAKFRPDHGSGADPRHPVTGVRWEDAAQFCNWLSAQENLVPFYDFRADGSVAFDGNANGYRLLSEAEWEWLARRAGRRKTVTFAWGDAAVVPKGAGNIADSSATGDVPVTVPAYTDGFRSTAPVGSFAAEASGLHDLTGNVSEWVNDRYTTEPPRPGAVFTDPLGPSYGRQHVVKGASFRVGDRTRLRPAWREGFAGARDDLGFRVARFIYGGTADGAE